MSQPLNLSFFTWKMNIMPALEPLLWLGWWMDNTGYCLCHPRFAIVIFLICSVTGWIIFVEYCRCSSSWVSPFGLLQSSWDDSGFGRPLFDFLFPDHTQLLSSTNYRMIDLVSSTMSWGINCSTDQTNLLQLLWRDSSWGKYIRFVLITGRFLPAVFPPSFLAN